MTPEEIKRNKPEVISKADAIKLGIDYFFTGNPCMYNQIDVRCVKTGQCKCFICVAKQKHKEKLYRESNPQKGRDSVNRHAKRKRIEKCNPVFTKPL